MMTKNILCNGLLVVSTMACGDKDGTASSEDEPMTGTNGSETTESGSMTATGDSAEDCSDYEGLITPEQAELTPRPQKVPEFLALQMKQGVASRAGTPRPVMASQVVYERVARDHAFITEERGELDPGVEPIHNYQGMYLYADEEIMDLLAANEYDPIKCPNELYGVQYAGVTRLSPGDDRFYGVELDGVYDIDQLMKIYGMLPNIDRVKPAEINVSADASRFISGSIAGNVYYYEVTFSVGPFGTGSEEEFWYCSLPGERPQEYDPVEGDPCEAEATTLSPPGLTSERSR